MKRLTSDKPVAKMGVLELAHNSCYINGGKARYRDYDLDEDARVLTRKLLKDHTGGDDAFTSDEDFDDWMVDYLQYGMDSVEGLIALLYRNLWAMADLREVLKAYEDIGLTPEQIKEMDRLYLEKCIEVNRCNCDWIPVEERLPDPNDDVLVSVQQIGGDEEKSVAIDCILDQNGVLSWGTFCTATEKVLAWQPRPMPYDPETDKVGSKKRVAYSFDNEIYSGSFDTVPEACAEALKWLKYRGTYSPGDMPEYVYIGECDLFEPSLSGSSWDIIDAIQCQAYDEGHGDHADDYLRVSKEKREELETGLERVFQDWIKKYDLQPDFYMVNKYDVYKYDAETGGLRLMRSDVED